MGYTENEPRTFVLKVQLHCENCAKDVKDLVLKKINGVDSVDVDQEQGKVKISGNVEPRTVIVMLKSKMKKHAELLVESKPRTNNQETQIVPKPVPKFVDQRKVSPLLPDPFYDTQLFLGSVFEFRQKPHTNRSICDACGMKIDGRYYRCKARNLDLHPRCSKLPVKLQIDDTDFELMCKNVKQRCFSCKKKLHSQLEEEEVPGWCYVSERNEFYCHVYCVYKMVKKYHDNDGTSKARDTVAKSNRSGGRAGGLFLNAVTGFFKAIASILVGDFIGLIVSVMELGQLLWEAKPIMLRAHKPTTQPTTHNTRVMPLMTRVSGAHLPKKKKN